MISVVDIFWNDSLHFLLVKWTIYFEKVNKSRWKFAYLIIISNSLQLCRIAKNLFVGKRKIVGLDVWENPNNPFMDRKIKLMKICHHRK